jgi:4-diphosphocytidyl-2-C-methyl-D-erythritol kinase
MIVFPNAKINIGLNIVEKRTDGYHNLETVFYPVGLRDALEIIPSDSESSLTISGIPVDGDPSTNLVMKAYQMLKGDFQLGNISVFLQKHIPTGAGLGGGSADGASMICLLNDYFALNLPGDVMEAYASRLGADCPFFVRNRPVFATGTGNEMEPVTLSLDKYAIVLVKPPFSVSTAEAYSMIIPHYPNISLKHLVKQPVEEWKSLLINDFELPVAAKYPQIAAIKRKLYDLGAVYASMSGSGSAVYGLFLRDSIPLISFPDCFVWTDSNITTN